jgi:hypothetical protein
VGSFAEKNRGKNLMQEYLKRYCPTKIKVSQKCYQLLAFLYCLAADVLNFYLKGHYSLKSKKSVSAFNDHKN